MSYKRKILGQVVSRLRYRKGLSQEVLSGLAGIARSHLAMIENGSKNVTLDTLWRISGALGLPLSALMKMVEDEIERESDPLLALY